MESWAVALLIIGCAVVLYYVLGLVVGTLATRAYHKLKNSPKTECDIDVFVGPKNPVNAFKCVMIHKAQLGNRKASSEPIELEVVDSPDVPGLRLTRKAGSPPGPSSPKSYQNTMLLKTLLAESEELPIVVATIRMGFGHHRLAYSAASWAMQTGRTAIFHDLLSIHSPEADLLKSTDDLYSRGSRWASEVGGLVEKIWGSVMLSGDADALRIAALTAAHLQPLLTSLPKDIPMITTHQLVALTASAAGFTNVHNLVVDNHPQWFLTVPNTMNLVLGPVNYESFLRMGVKADELRWVGHWCPTDLVQNIPADCQRRLARAQARARDVTRKPLRILIPVGSGGAAEIHYWFGPRLGGTRAGRKSTAFVECR